MARYAKPRTVDEALALLAEGRWRILAGGTDFYPAQGVRPIRDDVLDLNGLADLRGIAATADHWTIGARTSWSDVANAVLPAAFDALRQAAREVGSVQIQNTGTVGGNLCNASPAADGVPPLLTMEAEVELRSLGGVRTLPLAAFLLANRRTAIRPDELLTAIRLPAASAAGASAFVKLGARRYLVISIAMAAVRIERDADGAVARAAIAVGACSPVARRLGAVERALVGTRGPQQAAQAVALSPMDELSPIDDVRGSADYRREAVREIVSRAVVAAGAPPAGARAA